MNKNQKLLLGVAVLGVGGYLLWRSTRKGNFANFKSAGARFVIVPTCDLANGYLSASPIKITDTRSGSPTKGQIIDVYNCCGRGVFGIEKGKPCGETN